MKYGFACYEHGEFVISAPIAEGPPDIVYCPECHEESIRIYDDVPAIWHTGGAHGRGEFGGDYDKHGDKLERFNKNWSRKYGESPPRPARDVPKNSADIY